MFVAGGDETMTLSSPCPSRKARRIRRLAAPVLAALLAALAVSADAQTTDSALLREHKAEHERLQAAAAAATENLDVAQATADRVIAALQHTQALVDAQQADLDNAERSEADAEAVQRDAAARIAALEQELAAAKLGLRDALIESYVTFQTPSGSLSVLSDDPWRNAREEALAGFATGSRIDDIDDLRRLGSELERWRRTAEEATAQARSQREYAASLLAQLEQARSAEADIVAQVSERVERRLYEVQTLWALDAELASEIEREERRIAEALERQRRAEEEARRRAEQERRAALAASLAPEEADFTLVSVRGFYVNSLIETDTEGLLAAMEAEGYRLDGWGYRTHQAQISLRKAHCGTDDYSVWRKPASRCRPPTARPGLSNHEKGRAIDFTYKGRIISSRGTDVFKALKRIAPSYRFVNLPSEPWHWDNT